MTKFYTMKECFDECGDDDIPFIEDGWNESTGHTKAQIFDLRYEIGFPSERTLQSDKWQIKRAEPKVLSAEKVLKQFLGIHDSWLKNTDITVCRDQLLCLVKMADENGQNREYYRPEQVELREALEHMFNSWCANWKGTERVRVRTALKNLKPPKII